MPVQMLQVARTMVGRMPSVATTMVPVQQVPIVVAWVLLPDAEEPHQMLPTHSSKVYFPQTPRP